MTCPQIQKDAGETFQAIVTSILGSSGLGTPRLRTMLKTIPAELEWKEIL